MSYTKQTWETGDVITSEKLNHIEDGVANVDGRNPLITFNFSGFGSVSTIWGFAIGELDAGTYQAKRFIEYDIDTLYEVTVFAPNGQYITCLPLSVPTKEGWALLFRKPNPDYYETTVSGNISQTTVPLNFGTLDDAYIITGDCTIDIIAT